MSYKREFMEFMVRSGALTFGDFITKSGRRTPYFINTGNYKTGKQMARLGHFYAECIMDNIDKGRIGADASVLFGPAYKGIPIAVATSMALSSDFGRDIGFCFNRKEAKDHGEGGSIVGCDPKDGDSVIIVEDVITAGTSVRETLPLITGRAKVCVSGLVISVDRMERGNGELTAVQEIKEEFGIETFPIVTVREIIEELYDCRIDGNIIINDMIRERMEEYLRVYCL